MSRNFEATVTTRYALSDKSTYEQLMDLVKKENLPKSRAQLLLVERGLQHTNNPEPLIKEKVVYKDTPAIEKVVYKDRIVYKDRPKEEHIKEHLTNELVGGNDKGQRASADKLTTRDKADPPSSSSKALKEKKSAKEGNGIGGWIALGGFLTVIFAPMVYRWFTK